jgi:dihydroorotate dehydrogenase
VEYTRFNVGHSPESQVILRNRQISNSYLPLSLSGNLYLRTYMYKLVRKCLFLFDAEKVHYFSMGTLKILCSVPLLRKLIHSFCSFENHSLKVNQFGLTFKNPVGLGAGFDKNARYLNELEALGFGFVEIGTVTPLPQAGNDKPRLFRLAEDQALINRMGFNNDGVKAAVEKLKEWKHYQWKKNSAERMIVGGNIGKNKATPNEDAWKDYEICFIALFDYVDYFVVNVSSPNTPGLRELQEKDSLRKILSHLIAINKSKPSPKPLLLKIAPDLTTLQLDDVVDLSLELQLDGLVVANTTISREGLTPEGQQRVKSIGAGGLSGRPLKQKATAVLEYIIKKTGNRVPVIASGGIFTAQDAQEKLDTGADLIQVWTGFIYEGPLIVRNICSGLERTSQKNRLTTAK